MYDEKTEVSVAELRQRFSEIEIVLGKLASLELSEVHAALDGAISARPHSSHRPFHEEQQESKIAAELEAAEPLPSARQGLHDSGSREGNTDPIPDPTLQARNDSTLLEEIPIVTSAYPENPGSLGNKLQNTRKISGQVESQISSEAGQKLAIEARNYSEEGKTAAMAPESRARKDLVSLSVVDLEPGSQQQTKQKQQAEAEIKANVEASEGGNIPTPDERPDNGSIEAQSETPAELAWRWYYCTAEVDGDPGSLAAGRFILGHPPPAGFLTLTHLWPDIIRSDRESMIKALKKGISCAQMAEFWQEKYPSLTASAFIALLALAIEAPGELDIGREERKEQAGDSGL